MKRTLISVSLMAVSALALAGGKETTTVSQGSTYQLCDAATSTPSKAKVWGGSGVIPDASATLTFTRVGFDVQCSNNVHLYAQEVSSNLAVVASGSAKGNQSFGGSSNGGAISVIRKCTDKNDSCSTTDIGTTAIDEAIKKSSS